MVIRYFCTRTVDNGGMQGPVKWVAVRASKPDPEPRLTCRECDPATELHDWRLAEPDEPEPA